jgi:5,10-methylenetetrahydromethanopterin reductase
MTKVDVRFCASIVKVPLGVTLEKDAAFAKELEDLGFYMLCTGQDTSRSEMFVTATLAAAATERAKLLLLADPEARHPVAAAVGLSALQQFSGGRLVVDTGEYVAQEDLTGSPSANTDLVQTMITEWKKRTEYMLAVKGLAAGETVQYRGESLQMRSETDLTPVPSSAQTFGPETARIAGKSFDGAHSAVGISKEAVEPYLQAIAEGAKEAGRDPKEVDVWWSCPFCIAPTEAEGVEQVRNHLAARCTVIHAESFESGWVPEQYKQSILSLQREYRQSEKTMVGSPFNVSLLEKYGLKDFIANRHAIVGPPERIIERIQEIAEYGVRNIQIQLGPWGASIEQQRETARVLSDRVFPALL